MKVKFFTNAGNAPALEKEINQWLHDNRKIEILHIKQDYAYDNKEYFYTLISLWYKENK